MHIYIYTFKSYGNTCQYMYIHNRIIYTYVCLLSVTQAGGAAYVLGGTRKCSGGVCHNYHGSILVTIGRSPLL